MSSESVTKAVNIRHEPYKSDRSLYVYCGRAGHGEEGYFGNPFQKDFTFNGLDAFKLYEYYLAGRCEIDDEFKLKVAGLYGKTLGCFCVNAKGEGKCHAKSLAYAAASLNGEETL